MLHQILGVDPGIVHTGLVLLDIHTGGKVLWVKHKVVDGIDGQVAADWLMANTGPGSHRFQEKYKPRGALTHNTDMVKAEQTYQQALGTKLLLNTGVKKVVRRPLMELLGLWSFTTVTHHQDLRSAARIGIYGALKDEYLNTIIAGIVRDHIEGRTWDVQHH